MKRAARSTACTHFAPMTLAALFCSGSRRGRAAHGAPRFGRRPPPPALLVCGAGALPLRGGVCHRGPAPPLHVPTVAFKSAADARPETHSNPAVLCAKWHLLLVCCTDDRIARRHGPGHWQHPLHTAQSLRYNHLHLLGSFLILFYIYLHQISVKKRETTNIQL